jgi:flagella basal body P-ring formation protein FlgA
MQGKALANGAEGDRLLVQNMSSGKKVEGLVMAGGIVLIR